MRISNKITIALVCIGMASWTACGGEADNAAADQADSMGDQAGAMADQGDEAANSGQMAEDGAMAQAELPEGVTPEMVDQGRQIFQGAGLCHACHGQDGKGLPGLGANLTDDEWLHSDGSLDGIANTVTNGVSAEESSTGTPMQPKGGSSISDEQVKAVAAYVYTLSH